MVMLKRLTLVLLLITSIGYASDPLTINGLSIPGDEAVQVVRGKAVELTMPTENLMVSYFYWNYDQATGSTAAWYDDGPQEYHLLQSTETKKPVLMDKAIMFDGDDWLAKTGISWGSGEVTIYFVGTVSSTTPQYDAIFDTSAESAPTATRLTWYFDNTNLVHSHTNTGPGVVIDPRTQVNSLVWVSPFGTNSIPKTMLNGGVWRTHSATTNTGNPFTGLYIGTNYPQTIFRHGSISAFVVYNVEHTEAQARATLAAILARVERGY